MPLLLLLLLIASLPLSPALAADAQEAEKDRWYQVELLLFSRQSAKDDDEVWPMDPGTPMSTESLELFPPITAQNMDEQPAGEPPFPFIRLLTGDNTIPTPRAKGLTVLTHIRWLQPAINSDIAPAIHIEIPREQADGAGEDHESPPSDEPLSLLPPPPSMTEDRETDNAPLSEERRHDETSIVDGIVRLSLNRHLHVDLDLLYRPDENPLPQEKPQDGEEMAVNEDDQSSPLSALFNELPVLEHEQLPVFRLQQSRRIKVDDIHYFDHPYLGVLIRVSRHEIDTGDEDRAAP